MSTNSENISPFRLRCPFCVLTNPNQREKTFKQKENLFRHLSLEHNISDESLARVKKQVQNFELACNKRIIRFVGCGEEIPVNFTRNRKPVPVLNNGAVSTNNSTKSCIIKDSRGGLTGGRRLE
jgi:hypothetical protein